MRRNGVSAFFVGAARLAAVTDCSNSATAQVNCETIPPGPARTDCYIGLSRINRQKSDIATGVAQQQTDTAIYRNVTRTRPKKKRPAPPAW
jgi:hypothetical protein